MNAQSLACYQNGGTRVQLFTDGTKIRQIVSDETPVLCEQMDLKITDWCDAGCAWCHEGSTRRGFHGAVAPILQLLKPLPAGVEVAIGGGDPLSHPGFEDLVRGLRDQGLICSVTVNGRHLERSRARLERLIEQGSLFGVGVSFATELPQWDYEHMVVHMIAGLNGPELLDEAQRAYSILLLGYKQHGRGERLYAHRREQVQDTLNAWYRELFWVAQAHRLSFDNLAIAQLKPQRLFAQGADFSHRYMGPEGSHSMYLDAVSQTYALSSYAKERFTWSTLPQMFNHVRALSEQPAPAVV